MSESDTKAAGALADTLSDKLLALEGVTERPLWGEQGFLRGNRPFARWSVQGEALWLTFKLDAAAQREALRSGQVEAHPHTTLYEEGWVRARVADDEAIGGLWSMVESSYALAAAGGKADDED